MKHNKFIRESNLRVEGTVPKAKKECTSEDDVFAAQQEEVKTIY